MTTMDQLQQHIDNLHPPEDAVEDPTWGDYLFEEHTCDWIALAFVRDGGTVEMYMANLDLIAARIASGKMSEEDDPVECLADYWLYAGGDEDDFHRCQLELRGWIVAHSAGLDSAREFAAGLSALTGKTK